MDSMEVIINMIGSVGFPIVACVYMFKLFNDLQKTLAELNVSLTVMNERISQIETKLDDKKEDN